MGIIGTPRQLLGDKLEPALAAKGIHLERHARDGYTPTARTVMLRRDGAVRHPQAPQAVRRSSWALILLTHLQDTELADDDLDELLDVVLEVLEDDPDLPLWTAAERAVYGETTPAYEVTIPVDYQREEA